MQRRVEQADGDRQARHGGEDRHEVRLLHRQQLRERLLAPPVLGREDHLAHHGQALGGHEHVLGAAQPDALGAELARASRILGVSALARTPQAAAPSAQAATAAKSSPSSAATSGSAPA